ncbi:hypothetical protein [Magnetospirillum fulvum]|uniref:DNA translocase FtsK n=1 Tax=Magnetospirillum fulvum MGU-K5 TaxID=1316936 RepID=S9TMK9_MAGFU|nr:hypothetical protein [Magnetospirillum fulvum]EPY03511.1 DNA translocase FtsK [Magnetospirillum fulvum MGU-K5]
MSENDIIHTDLDAALANARGEPTSDVIGLVARTKDAGATEVILTAADAGLLDAGLDAEDVRVILGDMSTLAADVTGHMLDIVKNTPKPWQQMSRVEQQCLIDNLTIRSGALVRGIVRLIAAGGRQVILAEVKTVANKDKAIEATLTMRKDSEHRHALFDAQGLDVLIVVADAGDCFEGSQPEPDAPSSNQPELDFDGAGVEPDDGPVFDRSDLAAE